MKIYAVCVEPLKAVYGPFARIKTVKGVLVSIGLEYGRLCSAVNMITGPWLSIFLMASAAAIPAIPAPTMIYVLLIVCFLRYAAVITVYPQIPGRRSYIQDRMGYRRIRKETHVSGHIFNRAEFQAACGTCGDT